MQTQATVSELFSIFKYFDIYSVVEKAFVRLWKVVKNTKLDKNCMEQCYCVYFFLYPPKQNPNYVVFY